MSKVDFKAMSVKELAKFVNDNDLVVDIPAGTSKPDQIKIVAKAWAEHNKMLAGFETVPCDQTPTERGPKGPAFSINFATLNINPSAMELLEGSTTVDILYNKASKQILLRKDGNIPMRKKEMKLKSGEKRLTGYFLKITDLLKGYDLGTKYKVKGGVAKHPLGIVMQIGV